MFWSESVGIQEDVDIQPMILDDPSTHDGADYWLHPCAPELQGELMTSRERFFFFWGGGGGGGEGRWVDFLEACFASLTVLFGLRKPLTANPFKFGNHGGRLCAQQSWLETSSFRSEDRRLQLGHVMRGTAG